MERTEIDAVRRMPLADFLARLGHEPLRRVWDVDPRLTDTRSVEMTVMRLRDKLGAISASPLETLRSQGYRWNSSFVS